MKVLVIQHGRGSWQHVPTREELAADLEHCARLDATRRAAADLEDHQRQAARYAELVEQYGQAAVDCILALERRRGYVNTLK